MGDSWLSHREGHESCIFLILIIVDSMSLRFIDTHKYVFVSKTNNYNI